jgi:hypothetical protein
MAIFSKTPLDEGFQSRFLRDLVGLPLRLVFAMRRNSALLIDLYIPRDAPLSDFLERFPRFAASAAPAAICCFFDFAGIQQYFARRRLIGFARRLLAFSTKNKSGHQSARLKCRRRT